jgi:hypothetical protein
MEATHVFPRLRITLPDDWSDESVITFVAPAANGLAANVVITSAPRETAFYADVDRELTELKKRAKKYRLVSAESFEHHGRAAKKVEHRFVSGDNLEIRQLQLYVDGGATIHTASISHADAAFEPNRARFETVLQSLRFEDA